MWKINNIKGFLDICEEQILLRSQPDGLFWKPFEQFQSTNVIKIYTGIVHRVRASSFSK